MKRLCFLFILLFAAVLLTGCSRPADPVRETVRVVYITQEPSAAAAQPATSSSRQYVLNTNTKKFHYPNCKSVKQMKEKNKKIVTMSRSEIVSMGYSPCGNCHP